MACCASPLWCSFRLRALVFDLKTVFPPRRDVGTRVGARTHTRRGETECSSRSEAETCAGGLSWHNRPGEGETKSIVSAGMERSGMKDESKLNCGAREVPKRAQGVAWLRPSLLASFKLGNLEEEIQIK